MALLDRVTMLLRANLNDLIEKAEQPDKLLKQLLLDMQNQFMQVKTQVAIAMADQHLLEKKQTENLNLQKDWLRKAELAVGKSEDGLARVALERSLAYENAARNFGQQIDDQSHQVHLLRDALHRLEQKMTEARAKSEILIAEHRRARIVERASAAVLQDFKQETTFDRMHHKIMEASSLAQGSLEMSQPEAEYRLNALDKSDQVERLLADIKTRAAG